jgi:biopolymer transport protein ExbD
MAFKPSERRKSEEGPEELDLTPYMNFVMILIPVIMQASEYIKLAMIPINLPPAQGPSIGGPTEQETPEETLDLAVAITSGGFTITAASARLPIIPLKDDDYDYEKLNQDLWKLKQQAQGKYPDDTKIVIASGQDVRYEVIVKAMDATREYKENNKSYMMFPDVSLSSGIT